MLVSIVIPCHNCALTIDRAVKSVFAQSYENWELILVNNNSKDNTWQKLKEIKRLNPEKAISVLDEEKKGAPAARNKGLHHAKGEWIQFLDADDELLSEKIDRQIEIANSSEASVIYSPFFKVKQINNKVENEKIEIEHDFWKGLIKSSVGITSANLFKTKSVLEIDGWDESKTSSQEYDLMFRIAQNNGSFIPYDIPVALIHYYENSISNSNNSEKGLNVLLNFVNVRLRIILFLKSNNLINNEYQHLYDELISKVFILNFFKSPRYLFIQFNKLKAMSLVTRLKTNWVFLKLTIRIFFNILPK